MSEYLIFQKKIKFTICLKNFIRQKFYLKNFEKLKKQVSVPLLSLNVMN